MEDGREASYHVVRHPEHAARFEQYYWDAMAGSAPEEERPRVVAAAAPAGPPAGASARFSDDFDSRRMPAVLVAIGGLFSRIYSYFS